MVLESNKKRPEEVQGYKMIQETCFSITSKCTKLLDIKYHPNDHTIGFHNVSKSKRIAKLIA